MAAAAAALMLQEVGGDDGAGASTGGEGRSELNSYVGCRRLITES